MFFSFPALFILAGIGLVAAGAAIVQRRWRTVKLQALIGILWLAGFGGLVAVSLGDVDRLQQSFVPVTETSAGPATASAPSPFYMPRPPTSETGVRWLASAARSLVTDSASFPRWAMFAVAALMLVGAGWIWRRSQTSCLALLAPLVFALLASGLEKYPFGGRFTTFYVPFMLVLIGAGADAVVSLAQGLGRAPSTRRRLALGAGFVVIGFVLYAPLQSAVNRLRVPGREEIVPALGRLQSLWRRGDSLYVMQWSQYPLRYYFECGDCGVVRRGGVAESLWDRIRLARPGPDDSDPALRSDPPTIVIARPVEPDVPSTYEPELDELEGRQRVWLLMTHFDYDVGHKQYDAVVSRADQLGRRLESYSAPGARLLLYDFRR
jgi:hypothetical protein